jgi:hypothetical protein
MLPPYKRAVGFSPEKQSPIRESESRRLRRVPVVNRCKLLTIYDRVEVNHQTLYTACSGSGDPRQ